jgi:hypothetical protein
MIWLNAAAVTGLWRRLRGPWLLLLLGTGLAALVLGAGLVVFRPSAALGRPEPLPVGDYDTEIAWLYPASNLASWERFVTATQQTAEHLRAVYPDLEVQTGAAFPPQTTATSEIALRWQGSGRRLVFRWYKLTSKQKTAEWVHALLTRRPPPVAIIGGNTSDAARELATQLRQSAGALPQDQRPLLLFTTASADEVVERAAPAPAAVAPSDDAPAVRLNQIYPDRTFRFCFTNRQMAVAVTRFVWQHDELRPDCDPAHMVSWTDDAYSRDLVDGFWRALQTVGVSTPGERFWALGCLLRGGAQPDLGSAVVPYQPLGADGLALRLALNVAPPTPLLIDSSVGTFDVPNRLESQAALYLLKALVDQPNQRRPLLAVTGQSAPARRFLRALERNAPEQTRRCVVVTGDSMSFNTIYRDGAVTWPIQDLPYRLVFFCHHNPIDPAAGFRPAEDVRENGDDPGLTATTGTEDLLLFGDVVAALALGFNRDGQPCRDARQLGERFHDLHVRDGRLNFDAADRPLFIDAGDNKGNRHSGTGEHVVYLSPEYQGPRVLPRAVIEVWSWRTEGTGLAATSTWLRARGSPLEVHYERSNRPGDGQ